MWPDVNMISKVPTKPSPSPWVPTVPVEFASGINPLLSS